MNRRQDKIFAYSNAFELTASLFGVLAGIDDLLHGIGEILQGNVAPDGIIIESWDVGILAGLLMTHKYASGETAQGNRTFTKGSL